MPYFLIQDGIKIFFFFSIFIFFPRFLIGNMEKCTFLVLRFIRYVIPKIVSCSSTLSELKGSFIMLNKHDRPAESQTKMLWQMKKNYFSSSACSGSRGRFIIQEKWIFFFFYILKVVGGFIRNFLPTLILASPFTEEEKIFNFFYNLRVEGEFH